MMSTADPLMSTALTAKVSQKKATKARTRMLRNIKDEHILFLVSKACGQVSDEWVQSVHVSAVTCTLRSLSNAVRHS